MHFTTLLVMKSTMTKTALDQGDITLRSEVETLLKNKNKTIVQELHNVNNKEQSQYFVNESVVTFSLRTMKRLKLKWNIGSFFFQTTQIT